MFCSGFISENYDGISEYLCKFAVDRLKQSYKLKLFSIMEITISKNEGKMVAKLQGRLDTLCAQECEHALSPMRANASNDNVIDCSALEYISSSGLRIFLGLLKEIKANKGTLVLEGVNKEIRNIFSITGFSKLFTIKD